MSKRYKIIVASILAGSGHNSAADLLAQVLKENPRFEVVRFTHPSVAIDNTYNRMTQNSPFVHNFFVRHAPVISADAITLSMIHFVDECLDLVRKEQPDCVISTHFELAQWFKIARWVTKQKYLCVTAFPDLGDVIQGELPYDIYLRPDYSLVFDPETARSVQEKTAQIKSHIITAGHIPRREYLTATGSLDKNAAKEELVKHFRDSIYKQLSPHKTSILIAGGGGGIIHKTNGFLKKLANYQKHDIDLIDKYQFFVICGQNQKFYKTLLKQRKIRLSWQNIFPFGWLNAKEYALVQRAADYPILYGLAPATMHELMANECLPLIIHRLRADHERRNVLFVEKQKLGKFLNKDAELLTEIFGNEFLQDREKYLTRSRKIMAEEQARLFQLGAKIEEALDAKRRDIHRIYHADLQNEFFSLIISGILLFAYYLRRFVYKLFSVFPWLKELIGKSW